MFSYTFLIEMSKSLTYISMVVYFTAWVIYMLFFYFQLLLGAHAHMARILQFRKQHLQRVNYMSGIILA